MRVVHRLDEDKSCIPYCEAFKCSQRAFTNIGRRVYCRWADDDCVGPSCNYALCIRGRLLLNGICGLSVKRKTNEETVPLTIETPNKMNNIKLSKKLSRRIKEDDLF